MKIIFLCSTLEPGKDGVGDYTGKLAAELSRQGHVTALLAINDKYALNPITNIQHYDEVGLPTLRLPVTLTVNDRLIAAKTYIDAFNPDLLSLQFVLFGYSPKGLPFGIAKQLQLICDSRPLQIMFHELWIGITRKSPLKHKIYGFFQKTIIRSMVKLLKPKIINVSNGLHQALLKTQNIEGKILPLFSNIPIVPFGTGFADKLDKELSIIANNPDKYFVLGIFGHLHPQAKLDDEIYAQLKNAAAEKKELIFISFGRIGDDGKEEFERLQKVFAGSVKFLLLGEQSEQMVSMLFQVMNRGISCTPIEHIGKSGVYAAMRYHDLEVITPVSDYIPEFDSEIKKFNEYLLNRESYKFGVEYIAKSFPV